MNNEFNEFNEFNESNNELARLPPLPNSLTGNFNFALNQNQNQNQNENQNQNQALNLPFEHVPFVTRYPETRRLNAAQNITGINPFEVKPIQPMQPGGPVQEHANRVYTEEYHHDIVVIILAHSSINFAAQTYIGLPPGYKVKSISTQEDGLESVYILDDLQDKFLESFTRTREELETKEKSLFFENSRVIGTKIREGIIESLIENERPNNEQNENHVAFVNSDATYSTRYGMYSERIWEFSGWSHQGLNSPLNGYVLCFGRNLDRLGGRRIHPGDIEGAIGCVLLYETEISGGYELSQTKLLERLFTRGFVAPLIIDIGCNNAVGVPRGAALANLLNTGYREEEYPYAEHNQLGQIGEMGELALMQEEGRAAANAAEGLEGPNFRLSPTNPRLVGLDPVTLAMMTSRKYSWKKGGKSKHNKHKSNKHKSNKHKSNKHKSNKHKSNKHKSNKHKSNKHKSNKYKSKKYKLKRTLDR
jgi:hypothetical protein